MSHFLEPLVAPIREHWQRRTILGVICLALGVMVPAGFILYTDQIWEDFFIVYRHSENLANGHGLVYTVGERVHGFTSPLGALLPALFAWVTQAQSFAVPLMLFRLVSLAALFGALLMVTSVLTRDDPPSRLRQAVCALFPLLAVLEIKTTAYSVNGMEAGLMLGFIAAGFVLAYLGWPRKAVGLGAVCLAGLMYARPDGFIYALAIGTAAFAFGPTPRREFLNSFARSTAISIALYAPWIIFAQLYYGSFIPHSIIAKQGTEFYQSDAYGLFAPVVAGLAKLPIRLSGTFAAIYDFQQVSGPVTWPKWSHDVMLGLELAVVSYWVVPTRDRIGRMASLCSLLIVCYLTYASLIAVSSPWYYPPLAFLSLLTLVRMAVTLPGYLGSKLGSLLPLPLAALLLLFLAFIFTHSVRALRIKQEVVDWGNRRPLGLWLKEAVKDHETVFLEPVGYIGYFSQRKMLDWPGIVAPEVVAARKKVGRVPNYRWGPYQWAKGAEELKPDWIVARTTEVEQMRASEFLSREYKLAQVFNVAGQVEDAGVFYGCAVNYDDAVFQIFRRRPSAQ